ncbi:OmpA family protein [Algoriphagus namhaensis]
MNEIKQVLLRASGFWLLAFLLLGRLSAQEITSISGANSSKNDFNPVWIGQETLLFSRAFHPENLGGAKDPGDIWMISRQGPGQWSEAIHRADLSTTGLDVALGMQNVLTLLVFHEDEMKNKGVHEYAKFGKDWNYRRRHEVPEINEFAGLIAGSVVEGKLLFLSGEGPNSLGNEDIYVFELLSGITWSSPQNLGTVINTFGQEVGPFFDSKNQLLYFSTNNQPNSQGKDIYIAKKTGATWQDWSNPIRWDKVNSPGSEVAVAFANPEEVIWSSSQNSNGFSDLLTYSTSMDLEIPKDFAPALRRSLARTPEVPNTPSPVEMYSTEEKLKPLAPRIAVGKPEIALFLDSTKIEAKPLQWIAVDANDKSKVAFELSFFSRKNPMSFADSDSIMYSDLKAKRVDEVKITSPGYFPWTQRMDDLSLQEPNIALLLKAVAGNSIQLDQVSFSRGTAEFEGVETELSLKELSTFLIENEDLVVRIHGHTDNYGDPGLNKKLSLDRAKAVRDYLVGMGVSFERLRISGWGGSRPIASNATEAGRQKNRRVELEIQ